VAASVACTDRVEPTSLPDEPLGVDQCVVRVHGRSERGSAALVVDGRGELAPDGNAEFADGFEWRYADETEFESGRDAVRDVIFAAGCSQVVMNGFSNGASF